MTVKMKLGYVIICLAWTIAEAVSLPLSGCPCENKAWCQPVNSTDRKEIFIFSTKSYNWKLYDWSKVTTVANYGENNPELMCYAHSKGARVVKPVSFHADLTNKQDRATWVQQQIAMLKENYLDGINIDYEAEWLCSSDPIRDGLTALVQELGEAIRKNIVGGQLTFDFVWWPPSRETDVFGRCYNYSEIAKATDFVFIMSYDENWLNKTAWANSGYPHTVAGIKKYMSLGIPASKIVLGVPWYGYNYSCEAISQDNTCTLAKRGNDDPGGDEVKYYLIQSTLLPLSTTGRLWDESAKSPYFNYKIPNSDKAHQVWYDDPESLKYKYTFAQQMGLRGVGMWTADSINYTMTSEGEKERKEMWGGLPQY